MSSYTLPFRFVYQNANGVTTKRELISLTESDDYISGIQRLDNGMRTFSKSRIQKVLHTDSDWDNCPYPEPEARFDNRKQSTRQKEVKPEIAFTGFTSVKRSVLESLATESGMQVRKNITKNLGFLCTGPNAGPMKVAKASDMGIVTMDEDEFLWFVDTGEIPGTYMDFSDTEVDTKVETAPEPVKKIPEPILRTPAPAQQEPVAHFKEEIRVPPAMPDPQISLMNEAVTSAKEQPVNEVDIDQLLNKNYLVSNAEVNGNKDAVFAPTSADDFISATLPAGFDDSIEYVTITKTEYDDLLSIKEAYKGLKESIKPTRWQKIKNVFAWIGIVLSIFMILVMLIGGTASS